MSTEAEKAALEILQVKRARRGAPLVLGYWGTIVSAQTGPPLSVTLTIGGSAVNVAGVRYLASYASPTAADVVLLAKLGDDWMVLGKRA